MSNAKVCQQESTKGSTCMYVRLGLYGQVRSGRVLCYHDRGQHLRRDDHRRQGNAVKEGRARYGHQGGGQRQAGQGITS